MKDIKWYTDRMNYLLAYHRISHLKMDAMDAMAHMIWEPDWPDGVQPPDWWRNFPTPKLKNDLNTGITMFSKVAPHFKLMPLHSSQGTRDRANEIEMALQWQYYLSSMTGHKNITRNVVKNALKFDHVSIQVIYNKEQQRQNVDLSARKWNMPGDFTFVVHKPTTVFPEYSSYGMESQLLVKKTTVQDVKAGWGSNIKALNDLEEATGSTKSHVYLFDWTDHRDRIVLCFPSSNTNQPTADTFLSNLPVGVASPIEVFVGEHGLPFMPWVDVIGGADDDELPENQHRPLLDTAYEGDQYNSANILRSALRSLVLANLVKTHAVTKTMDGEPPEVDRSQALPIVNMTIGETYDELPSPQLDHRLSQLVAEDDSEMGGGTIPGILSSPSLQRGVSFSSINHQYQVAESKLDVHITTAEQGLADMAKIMLQCYIHYKDPLTGYEVLDKNGQRFQAKNGTDTQKSYTGNKINIPASEIPRDVARGDAIYLTAKLTATHPIDETQKLNGGLLMKQVGYPQEEIFEALDEANPQELRKRQYVEMFTDAAIQKHLKPLMAEGDAEAQLIVGRVQQQLQQEAMKAQQAAQQPPAPGGDMPPGTQPPAGPQAGMNPGGLPPGMAEQQANMGAVAGNTAPPANLEAITAAAKGQRGGALPAQLGPGMTTKEAVSGPRDGVDVFGKKGGKK